MSINFKSIAQKQTALSHLMENRTKISTADLIANYPDGVTITEFDFVVIDGNSFPVLVFAEDNTRFFFGGYILNKIFNEFVTQGGGDITGTSDDLKSSGGLRVKMKEGKTKANKSVTMVEII